MYGCMCVYVCIIYVGVYVCIYMCMYGCGYVYITGVVDAQELLTGNIRKQR